ncbi:IclR family transcriptional regulator [Aminobacter sp. MSH1]|uniref:IclR family transcriptional regulator n=1 Tax=Aminobacter sp. MSH1 TaxID=374606 RepID=UPI000D3A540F|nr:IclR family transcriptional regulator [Aminobacter sp. MSH1]
MGSNNQAGTPVPEAAGGVQSLHRAVSILQSVARARDGIGLADLCKEVELHSSTTFHLAKTMVTLGLIRQNSDNKRYRVGPRLFALASGALDEIELLNVALPFMEELASATKENSHIAARSGRDVVIIGKVDGSASIRMSERIGSARPAHATAIGKILLSALSEENFEKYLATTELFAVTPKTITDSELLRQHIAEVRDNKVAYDDGEFDPEVRCAAAPVYNFNGQIIAAIGITAPVWRFSLTKLIGTTELIKDVAGRLSAEFGFRQP